MKFVLHQSYSQYNTLKERKIWGVEEGGLNEGVCYSLCMEWVNAVCTDKIPNVKKLNIFRAISHQRAFRLFVSSSDDVNDDSDPFHIFRVANDEKLSFEEYCRLRSHETIQLALRHTYSAKCFSKKLIAYNFTDQSVFATRLAEKVSNCDAVMIYLFFVSKEHKFKAHVLAMSCSTSIPILFDPNSGQYVYRGSSSDKQDLADAIVKFLSRRLQKFSIPFMHLTAVGLSATNRG
ncbi:MAG: hypothetical protein LPH19_14640 [Shewanella sp.]|nr:hypothetical protein [Shewanella sp.]MCF1432107.1 hypothetical protein [Shewanella sp.]